MKEFKWDVLFSPFHRRCIIASVLRAQGPYVPPYVCRFGGRISQPRNCFSTLADGLSFGAAASLGTALYVGFSRWNRRMESLVQSGAAASCNQLQRDSGGSAPCSQMLKSPLGDVEYVLQYDASLGGQLKASADGQSMNSTFHPWEVLFFFHGGLGGSDQFLASGFTPPAAISHIFLPNRFGYFRSTWMNGISSMGVRGRTLRQTTEEELRKSRFRMQANAFYYVLQRILDDSRNVTCAPLNMRCHLLAIGEGCAHAAVFAHLFPELTKTISLIDPIFGFDNWQKEGPLTRHILWRLQMHQRLMKRLPPRAIMPPPPAPKLGFLEWVGGSFANKWPVVASEIMISALLQNRQTSSAFVAQALQQVRDIGWPTAFKGKISDAVKEATPYWHLMQILQCLTGTSFLCHRMHGFLEDIDLLAPSGTWSSDDENESPHNPSRGLTSITPWLFNCLESSKAPLLLVHSSVNRSQSNTHHGNLKGNTFPEAFEILHLPDAHPCMLLFTHGIHLKGALERLMQRASGM